MSPSRRLARRAAVAFLLLGAGLSGCPLPQPLPEYPENQPVPPPRIMVTSATFPDVVVRVPAGCATKPAYELGADLFADPTNTVDVIEARWFVNYSPESQARRTPMRTSTVPPADDPLVSRRTVPPWMVVPYDHEPVVGTAANGAAAGALHVVELVVSNGFLELEAPADLPNRTARAGFETQLYRWVFLNVPPDDTTACPE